jgi:hypothetical protein
MEDKPYKVIVMKQEDWVAFRWQIALDVISAMTDVAVAQKAVSTLRAADDKVDIEWREGPATAPVV